MPGRISPGKTAEQRKKEIDAADNAKLAKAEAMFEKMIQQGKVTPANIRKIKERIANKTGAYPLGGTN
jgi:hypothetical protein